MSTMLTRTRAASCLMFLFAAVVLLLSQFPAVKTVQAPAEKPVFHQTLEVPFIGDALHGARGGVYQQKQFTVDLNLQGNARYTVSFVNSDFQIDSVTIRDLTAVALNLTSNFGFETMSNSAYSMVVSGHYMFNRPVDWGNPAGIGQHARESDSGAGGFSWTIDDTVDIAITPIVEKTEYFRVYGQIWPIAPLLFLFGILMFLQKR